MEYNSERKDKLWGILKDKLKDRLKYVLFIELKKDLVLKNNLCIKKDVLLPIKSEYLLNGIKTGEYIDSIKLNEIISSIIFVMGSDSSFKYNDSYLKILMDYDNKIENYILKNALEYAKKRKYFDSIVYFNALSFTHKKEKEIKYNTAIVLKEMAEQSLKNKNRKDYRLYHDLSFYIFFELKRQYPDFPYSGFYLGFYYAEEKEYDMALKIWGDSYRALGDPKYKDKLKRLMDAVSAQRDFEHAKQSIDSNHIEEALRILIPLIEKYDKWSEAIYYTALAYRKVENYAKAELLLNNLLKNGECFSEIYNELGLCKFFTGDIEDSIKYFEKAVHIKRDNAEYLCNLALAYSENGEHDKAMKMINEAYDKAPDDDIIKQSKQLIENR
mgnify:FL=1